MNVAFMASDSIALPSIRTLHELGNGAALSCIISNADKPKGRGKIMSPNDISQWALDNGIPLLRPEKAAEKTLEWIKGFDVDCIIVMAYGHMLRDHIINYPRLGCLNLHASLLPKLRGASPVETAIATGEKITGVSLMRISKKMDSGDVCAKKSIAIGDTDTGASLRKKIAECARELLLEKISDIKNSSLVFEKQDENFATYCRKLDKSDMRLDFSSDAAELERRVRAFNGAYFEYGADTLKTDLAYAEDPEAAFGCERQGEVLEASAQKGLRVACARGAIRFARLQCPCAKMLGARDFFNAHKIAAGEKLGGFKNFPLLVSR